MPELKDFASSVAIVVSTCDAFFDVWRPFTYFFWRFWPDCPLKTFLIVNELSVQSQRIRPLIVGPDRGWASNLRLALEQISETHILYMQEDYFLTGLVDNRQLAVDFGDAMSRNADSLCFRSRSRIEPMFQSLNNRFGIVPLDSDGRTRCQVTLWNRAKLLSILRDGESGWEMEAGGSDRTRDMLLLSYGARHNTPIPYLMSAIVRGLWMPGAIELCSQNGVGLEPRYRSTYSSYSILRRLRRSISRRKIQRRLAALRGEKVDLDIVT